MALEDSKVIIVGIFTVVKARVKLLKTLDDGAIGAIIKLTVARISVSSISSPANRYREPSWTSFFTYALNTTPLAVNIQTEIEQIAQAKCQVARPNTPPAMAGAPSGSLQLPTPPKSSPVIPSGNKRKREGVEDTPTRNVRSRVLDALDSMEWGAAPGTQSSPIVIPSDSEEEASPRTKFKSKIKACRFLGTIDLD
ncbi:hypothetical protein CPC08DRAFT_716011 [Agrocybe pediades]|nr:hypothetical protein CPC08DRAFT_716011 [Agrocybe pediades]